MARYAVFSLMSASLGGSYMPSPPPVPFYMYEEEELLGGERFMDGCFGVGHHEDVDWWVQERVEEMGMPPVDLRYRPDTGVIHEFAATKYFVRMMRTHPWRVRDVHAAEAFVVPIDIEPVALQVSGKCSFATFDDRLLRAMRYLLDRPGMEVAIGANHLWVMAQNFPEKFIRLHAPRAYGFLTQVQPMRHMIVGTIEMFPMREPRVVPVDYFGRADGEGSTKALGPAASGYRLERTEAKTPRPWRCTLPMPFVQSFAFGPPEPAQEDFDTWMQRKYMFYHQFGGRYQGDDSKLLREHALLIPGLAAEADRAWIGDSFVSSEKLREGFARSRFCFAIAGRNGGPTRKFYDAVAHLCIPVVVSDQWAVAFAPFGRFVDHEAYAIFVPERRWLSDLPGVVRELESLPEAELRRRFAALQAAAPLLTYDRPDSYALGAATLWEAKMTCGWPPGLMRNDSVLYPIRVDRPRYPLLGPGGVNGLQVASELRASAHE
eukprot:TRINITY_DN20977_c0_g4_i1.p1 TRINITY_DN20977_c0_g4~~TRINITY_DN20977_c0_g4_i1.p1  ORF type:complete len:510 (-),score=80.45 TRINITY_DN20977_c0_g4_i1:279-1748(-)